MIEEVYGHLSPDHRRRQMAKLKLFAEIDGAESGPSTVA
jgi:hypothetical protein